MDTMAICATSAITEFLFTAQPLRRVSAYLCFAPDVSLLIVVLSILVGKLSALKESKKWDISMASCVGASFNIDMGFEGTEEQKVPIL